MSGTRSTRVKVAIETDRRSVTSSNPMLTDRRPDGHLHWDISPERASLTLRGIGTAEITPGATPRIRLDAGTEPGDAAALLAPAVPMSLLLDRRWPLRAGAVESGGRAIVLTGPPAGGVSTATAAAVALGARPLADGHVVIDLTGDGSVTATSGAWIGTATTTIDLWPDALRAIGWDDGLGTEIRRGVGKRRIDLADPGTLADHHVEGPVDGPVEVSAIVALTVDPLVDRATVDTIRGFDALRRLTASTWHNWAISRLGRESEHLARTVALAATTPVLRVGVPDTGGRARDTVRAVEVLLGHLDRRAHTSA